VKIGISVRLMGPASLPDVLVGCALAAERAGLDEIWVPDHIAIPPDDAEGSNGRYLDPLTSLAWLAARTERIALGTGVLILPYRSALPTAKALATVQELSGGRLQVGVGVGWMKPEFQALGLDRHHRGATTDEALDLFRRCFDAQDDVVEENGQPFLFRPRPARPPIFVGGAAPHALERAVRYADGWMPMGLPPEKLAGDIARLRELSEEAGKPVPEVVSFGGLPGDGPEAGAEHLAQLQEIGVTRFATGSRYESVDEFTRSADALAAVREAFSAR
jgi:probable F420-dependent oxidoreductase